MQKAEPGWGTTKEKAQFLFMLAKLRPVYTQLRFDYLEKIWKNLADFNTFPFLSWDFYCAQTLLFFPLKMKAEVHWTDTDGTRHCQATLTWNQQFASLRAL